MAGKSDGMMGPSDVMSMPGPGGAGKGENGNGDGTDEAARLVNGLFSSDGGGGRSRCSGCG